MNYQHYYSCINMIASEFSINVLRWLMYRDAWEQTLSGNIVTHEAMAPLEEAIRRKEEELCAKEFQTESVPS